MKKMLQTCTLITVLFFAPKSFAADVQHTNALTSALENIDLHTVEQLIDDGIFTVNESGEKQLQSGMTRADFIEIIMQYIQPNAALNLRCFDVLDPDMRPGFRYHLLFSDVTVYESYAPALCSAMLLGIINGYEDGSFRPQNLISFAEAAKILNHAFGLEYAMPDYDYELWYATYVHTLEQRSAVPDSVTDYIATMTTKQATDTLSAVLISLRENPVTYPNEWPLWD